MKHRQILSLFTIVALSLFFVNCGEEECTYTYDAANTKVEWTAYKFTERAGVGGTFNTVAVTGVSEGATPQAAIQGAVFQIPTDSVNTNNPDRDAKIVNSFFGTMQGENISGAIQSIDERSGVARINMNGQERDIPLVIQTDGPTLTATAEIDVTEWGAGGSIEALNEVCRELHIGEDGVSKLWPDVSLKITSTFASSCQ